MEQFSFYVSDDETVDLSLSLLNEDDGVWLSKSESLSGAVAFDQNFRVLPLISEFLSYNLRNRKISRQTAKTYAKNLTYFLTFLKKRREFKNSSLDEAFLSVSKFMIEEYLSELRTTQDLSTATIRNRDSTLQAFIHNFLYQVQELRDAYIEKSPYSAGLISGPVKQKLVISCSIDELAKLMEQTQSERERVVLQFIFDSGIRRAELENVTKQDLIDAIEFNSQKLISRNTDKPVSMPYAPISIQGVKGRNGNKKQRMTLVSKATLERVLRYHASPLFKKYARKYSSASETPAFFNGLGLPITAKCLSKLLERLSQRAVKRQVLSKSISPHKLRHGYAYDLLQSPDLGQTYVDRLAVVQKSLGHAYLSSTEVYTKIPLELYKTLTDSDGELLTKAERMERLTEKTQLKIFVKDTK
ncbi:MULTISPECIES: tyrosine-type recombinase/integrase [Rheinheimera]|jgi:integrase/recombinase XerD|uniref:Tyrosine-type recombinase/integrase n=1 Tax=Rheinheimera tangshanensis TaxID=400153 RepID=A0A5C8LU45_9GAMM|nr:MULTISPECIES: tyrosine-type recombinase/integrase [Rheinheimera]MCA1929854.1 tyrosine-type recombinase/integrase [Rheinheimera sp.]TXK79715.1 tyrosine-type recombinase/integrase [Rheinheimera tangshanensis]GGM67093.1 tyrosine recombinase XerC [Rheinheimera tangshanensis]